MKRYLVIIFTILIGSCLPISGVANARECLILSDDMLTPMSFTISEWTSNGISKEYIDSSYRAFGKFGVEPWVKDSYYLPSSLLSKLNEVPVNEKNVEVWFEKSSSASFQDAKRIRWAEFPSVYKPYLEVDTIIDAEAGDWLRFVASIQIKDCGPPKILRSAAAKYPQGKFPLISIETLKQLKEGSVSPLDSTLIIFDKNGASPWHFLTVDSIDRNFQTIKDELSKARKIGERFLLPSYLGSKKELRLTIRPFSPTDCFGFEFRNLRYTNDGWELSFSKLPCEVSVSVELPAKLYSGPPLLAHPTMNYFLDCFTCSTNVVIYKGNVKINNSIESEVKQDAYANDNESSSRKTTITCVKGKLVKKVTAVKPKCPSGYKIKK